MIHIAWLCYVLIAIPSRTQKPSARRGNACLVLNMMSHTLPPLLQQIVAPLLQLRGHGLNSGDLLNAHHLGPCRYMLTESGFRQVNDDIRGVVIDVFAESFQHLDGGSDFCGCGCSHNQT